MKKSTSKNKEIKGRKHSFWWWLLPLALLGIMSALYRKLFRKKPTIAIVPQVTSLLPTPSTSASGGGSTEIAGEFSSEFSNEFQLNT